VAVFQATFSDLTKGVKMCGTFSVNKDKQVIRDYFLVSESKRRRKVQAAPTHENPDHYQILFPGMEAPVLRANGELVDAEWGLIPAWSKDSSIQKHTFNARAETLNEKPSFKEAWERSRCLVPAASYFEWKATNLPKTKYEIFLGEFPLFAMAGLYGEWRSPSGTIHRTFSIVTTTPNPTLANIHHRMPVLLKPEDEELWLTSTQPDAELRQLCSPYEASIISLMAMPQKPPKVNKTNPGQFDLFG
jgi:putative SOS response-associated peptidase YedK